MALLLRCSPARAKLNVVKRFFTPNVRYLSQQQDTDHLVITDPVTNAPDGRHQIYKGLLTNQVRIVKTFSFCTSIMGIGLQPVLYQGLTQAQGGVSAFLIAASSCVAFLTIFTPLILHLVTKKYVTEIYYDPSIMEYTAYSYNFLPSKREIKFKIEDIHVPDVTGAFTSFHIKKVPLFCAPDDFMHPEHYIKFMGYDKPIDFQLSKPKEQEPKESDKSM